MDFGQLPRNVLEIVAAFAVAANTTLTPAVAPPSEVSLQYPALISSHNLAAEKTSLNQNTGVLENLTSVLKEEDITLKLVTKEPEDQNLGLVTVEQPIIYTVIQPSPKPVEENLIQDKKDSKAKIELVKEAKVEEPSPSPSSTPKPSPTPLPLSPGNSNSEQLFQMVNDHRAKLGLKTFEKDERLCKIARDRAPQINTELASGALHQGFKALNLPYWATENIAAYQTIEDNLKFWLSDYIHKKAIEGDSKYSCLACEGSSCSQIFTSFIKK